MLKPLMASPISLAPMIRHITAMMTARRPPKGPS